MNKYDLIVQDLKTDITIAYPFHSRLPSLCCQPCESPYEVKAKLPLIRH